MLPAWFTECYGMHKQKVALMISFQHSRQLTMGGAKWQRMLRGNLDYFSLHIRNFSTE